jgi:hypothetical protein
VFDFGVQFAFLPAQQNFGLLHIQKRCKLVCLCSQILDSIHHTSLAQGKKLKAEVYLSGAPEKERERERERKTRNILKMYLRYFVLS